MADIIIVEDNEEIGGLLADFLEAEGYDTYLALSGEEALEVYAEEAAKLIILDIMLPGMDGFAVCSKIREHANIPIIIVSAKEGKEDKLNGLFLGADDYIEKPYDIDILLAKVGRHLYLEEKEVPVTTKELDLMIYLMENKGKVLSKEELFHKIWGFDSDSEPQTLTVHIKWLREKLEKDPKRPRHIQTVWGVGYRFD